MRSIQLYFWLIFSSVVLLSYSFSQGWKPIINWDIYKSTATDPPASFAFTSTSRTVTEGDITTICAVLDGAATEGAASVELQLVSDASPHLVDFKPAVLSFPEGSSPTQCVEVLISFTETDFGTTSYQFVLANPRGDFPVQIGAADQSNLIVKQLEQTGCYISTEPKLEVLEGAAVEICVELTEPLASTINVPLVLVANTGTHFANRPQLDFTFEPGKASACQRFEIPFSSAKEAASYQFSLQPSAAIKSIVPKTLEVVVNPVPEITDCWSTLYEQNFNNTSLFNLTDADGIVSLGFVRSEYGATGFVDDVCARLEVEDDSYLGVELPLEAGYQYQLQWNAKTSTVPKMLDVYLGEDLSSARKIGGNYQLPVAAFSDTGTQLNSQPFAVEAGGNYVLFIKGATNNATEGAIRVDDISVKKSCLTTQEIEKNYTLLKRQQEKVKSFTVNDGTKNTNDFPSLACYQTFLVETFINANANLTNVPGLVQSGEFSRGSFSFNPGVYNAQATVAGGEYIGFEVILEAGKPYLFLWAPRADVLTRKFTAEIGTSLSNTEVIPDALGNGGFQDTCMVPVLSNAVTQFQHFYTPDVSGSHYFIVRSHDDKAAKIEIDRFDAFVECYPAQFFLC